MTSSPEGEVSQKMTNDGEQKMTRIYHPSIQCLCVQSFNLPGVNIFQWWIFFIGEYFSVVNIFQGWIFFKEKYFSGVNIFQVWISFRGEYFSGVNIFLLLLHFPHSCDWGRVGSVYGSQVQIALCSRLWEWDAMIYEEREEMVGWLVTQTCIRPIWPNNQVQTLEPDVTPAQ